MSAAHSDALVFFDATGDLAYYKIFPSLQAMLIWEPDSPEAAKRQQRSLSA